MVRGDRLSREKLERLKVYPQPEDLESVFDAFRSCEVYMANAPAYVTYNPKKSRPITSCQKRQFRVHDNGENKKGNYSCVICQGFEATNYDVPTTTPVIHSSINEPRGSFSFTNMNMFPGASPKRIPVYGLIPKDVLEFVDDPESYFGVHALTWASNEHKDIHQLHSDEHEKTLDEVLAVQELVLSKKGERLYPRIIKNTGAIAGCSLEHGHYQMLFSNLPTGEQIEDLRFLRENGFSYTDYLRRNNPSNLDVFLYGNVRMIIPMDEEKSNEVVIVPNSSSPQTLRDALGDPGMKRDISQSIQDYSRALYHLFDGTNKDFGYNLYVVEGLTPDSAMRIHIVPSTQITAGMELSGSPLRSVSLEESRDILIENIEKSRERESNSYNIIPNKK